MIIILVGIAGLALTVALHSVATTLVVRILRRFGPVTLQRFERKGRAMVLGFTAAFLAVKHYLDMVLWAIAYMVFAGKSSFESFENALYFSTVTYTSLGYGDIVLTGPSKLMCGVQAMNGILLFGWSTAILFVLVQRMWAEDIGNGARSNTGVTEST